MEKPVTLTTFQIVNGQPVPDVSGLDAGAALARKRELERALALTRGDPAKASERDRLRSEDAAVSRHLAELKEATKALNIQRSVAGMGSPLHDSVVAKLDPVTVAELERDALTKLAERKRRTAERKASKGGA